MSNFLQPKDIFKIHKISSTTSSSPFQLKKLFLKPRIWGFLIIILLILLIILYSYKIENSSNNYVKIDKLNIIQFIKMEVNSEGNEESGKDKNKGNSKNIIDKN
ncbi:unnamed protein product [Meloidogyne enterolobii]|uniref:Uncharacterized protein n=1 Tax=Meloidogyne enterolobii TaxID=390850 RepID=A0ACB0YAU7_MELEN